MGLSVLTVTLGAREDVGVDAVEVAVVEVGGGVLGSQDSGVEIEYVALTSTSSTTASTTDPTIDSVSRGVSTES